MKKLLTVALTGALVIPAFLGGTNASAQTIEEDLTKDFPIDWEQLWEEVETYDSETQFGLQTQPSNGISLYSYGSLATGSTFVTGGLEVVTSRGKTTGKVALTITSATTSVRDVAYGITSQGGKGMGIGSVTANSTASIMNTTGTSPFTGLTVHTATSGGQLYSSATGHTTSL